MPALFALLATLCAGVAAACEPGTRPGINVVAEPAPVVVATDLGLAELVAIAQRAGTESKPPGFYASEVLHEVSVQPGSGPNAFCTANLRVIVTVRLADRRIEVAREMQKQQCRFNAVLDHYRKKAEADKAVFASYVTAIQNALLAAPVPPVETEGSAGFGAVRQSLERWVKAIVTPNLQSLHLARVSAFRALDTEGEFQRISTACSQHA